jgi:hypothetical protein
MSSLRLRGRVPVTGPDERRTSPLRALFLLAAGTQWARADPECPATVHARLLGCKADAWLLVALAAWYGLLCKQLRPVFLADDGINH